MASKLGISQSTYQKIETGRVNVTKERLIEIANILGKEMEDFLPNSRKNTIDKSDIDALKEIIASQVKEIKELKLLLSQHLSLRQAQTDTPTNVVFPIR